MDNPNSYPCDGCGCALDLDAPIWFLVPEDDFYGNRARWAETSVGHSDCDALLSDGYQGYCSPDCGHESMAEGKAAAWFDDAAYGRGR